MPTLRVFPRKTNATPQDKYVAIDQAHTEGLLCCVLIGYPSDSFNLATKDRETSKLSDSILWPHYKRTSRMILLKTNVDSNTRGLDPPLYTLRTDTSICLILNSDLQKPHKLYIFAFIF